MIKKNIEGMTIVEYMEYKAEMERKAWKNTKSYFPSNYDNKDVNSLTIWKGGSIVTVKQEGNISGTLWYQLLPKELNPGSFTLPCTIGNLNLYVMVDLGASINIMPISIFKHLKLVDLKETDMTVVMANMTEKTPLGITENVLVKINKFLFSCDFIITDTIEDPNETIILGRSFLAMIHAQIDVFKRKISLGIGEDRVLFDMDGNVYQSCIPVKKVYVTNSISKEEPFNPLEIREDLFSYESLSCLQFEQRSRFCDDESIDTVDPNDEMQEPEDVHKKDCRMWPTCNPDLSFCSGYDAINGKGENGMLEQWMCFWDNERQSIGGNRMTFAVFLKLWYGSKSIDNMTHERRYYEWIAQNTKFEDDGIPKETIKYDNHCKYQHEYPHSYFTGDKTKPCKPSFNNDNTPRDQENTSQNLFCQEDPISNIKTYFLDFSRTQPIKPRPRDYSFKEWLKIKLGYTNFTKSIRNEVLNEWVMDSFDVEDDFGKTRDDPYSTRFNEYKEEVDNKIEQLAKEYDLRLDDALPLGRVNNGSRFIGMIRKEMDEDGRAIRKM
ncbi:phospholipase-like protein [Tanacetum coccineum]